MKQHSSSISPSPAVLWKVAGDGEGWGRWGCGEGNGFSIGFGCTRSGWLDVKENCGRLEQKVGATRLEEMSFLGVMKEWFETEIGLVAVAVQDCANKSIFFYYSICLCSVMSFFGHYSKKSCEFYVIGGKLNIIPNVLKQFSQFITILYDFFKIVMFFFKNSKIIIFFL